ncbi:MAG: tRNA (adenosine(37)-N6)-dimethylallyltransferase MiaA [Patescibacteria group bacterium]|nr:tRNA (adenosine(37)-N6)-dimethylallyltransferase MiaA [Patescibacteria group bacterium]
MSNRDKNIKNEKKIIAILGPTAAGKTKLAVKLAYQFNGEIVSADSRQVYKWMDIGTGKDLKDYCLKLQIQNYKSQINSKYKIQNSKTTNKKLDSNTEIKKLKTIKIPYHLIDVVSPKTEFNLAKYQKLAYKAIDDILAREKIPFLTGGSGLYLQAVVDGYNLSDIKPDKKLRAELEKLNAVQLFALLRKIDFDSANNLNKSDKKNSRRLIRYIESAKQSKIQRFKKDRTPKPKYNSLIIGLTLPKNELNKKIDQRMKKWFEQEDMLGEIKNLRSKGVSWKRLNEFGLEYRLTSDYLRGKINFQEMKKKLSRDLKKFAKKQMTWFRRWEKQGAKIHWIKNQKEAKKLIKNFI